MKSLFIPVSKEYFASHNKNPVVASLLAIFFGSLGVQKFYLGKIWQGVVVCVLFFITFGLSMFIFVPVTIYEGILYLLIYFKTQRAPSISLKDSLSSEDMEISAKDKGGIEVLIKTINTARKKTKSKQDNSALPPLDRYSYPSLDSETMEKVNDFQKIVNEIESKTESEPQTSLLDNREYSVDYEHELNQSQLYAVTEIKGPMLVIAGAGSGKTRIIVYRVSYLIENDVRPDSILLLTFTRKAAKEMLDRVKKITKSKKAQKVKGGTFHSFALESLRRYHKLADIDPSFTIIDTADSADAISLVKNELGIKKKKGKLFPNKNQLQTIISASRNRQKPIEDILKKEYKKYVEHAPVIERIKLNYDRYKRAARLYDYDDLLETFRNKLKDNEGFRKRLQKRYQYILVDEYQDTNVVQREILNLLTNDDENIMVVGDDAQSIYAFRGANFENILYFPRDFPNCKVVKIERNYRSTSEILDFTNSMINKAVIGYKKTLVSDRSVNEKPKVYKFYEQTEEAEFIADKIEELHSKGRNLKSSAVLYRATWHGNFIQNELTKRNIPFIVVGGIKFVERKHVKDVMAYLRITTNRLDAIAWHRLLTKIYGIGNVTASQIIEEVSEDGYEFVKRHKSKKYYDDLKAFVDTFEKISTKDDLRDKINSIYDHYYSILEATEEDADVRKLDLETLRELAANYKDAETFINDFTLEPPNQSFQDGQKPITEKVEDYVTLSTTHSAKGLEWNTVFIPHAIDGLFPSDRSFSDLEDIEEERRLFYVATTRAKNRLFITMPSYSFTYDSYFSMPSRFIIESQENPDDDNFEFYVAG